MQQETGRQEPEGFLDLIALWNLLWRNKILIVVMALVGAGIATALALTATPLYRAEVTVTEVTDPAMGAASSLTSSFGGIAALAGISLSGGAGEGADMRAILHSRQLSEAFMGRPGVIAQVFPNAKPPPTMWFAVKRFRESTLSISEDIRKGTTTIAMVSASAANAARWANEYVALANEIIRARALDEANRSIAFLNAQIAQTSAVEIQRVMYNLIENETKVAMLANARKEYAFAVVDPAVVPELRFSPRRTLMVILGFILGGGLGVVIALVRGAWRRSAGARAASV